jgi:hypothetical protein
MLLSLIQIPDYRVREVVGMWEVEMACLIQPADSPRSPRKSRPSTHKLGEAGPRLAHIPRNPALRGGFRTLSGYADRLATRKPLAGRAQLARQDGPRSRMARATA